MTISTAHDLVAGAIDRLCELHVEELKNYYGDDISVDDTTPLDVVRSITVAIRASTAGELYLVFEADYDMDSTVLEAHLPDDKLAGSILLACQVELSRYQKVAGATHHV